MTAWRERACPAAGAGEPSAKDGGGHVFKNKRMKRIVCSVVLLMMVVVVFAQDGNAGIQDANNKVRSYFNSGTQLMYAIGGIIAIIGAVKVYSKWNHGDHDTGKVAAAWFGSCVFLVVVVTVIRAFFGI
jgi:hypothetical protein